MTRRGRKHNKSRKALESNGNVKMQSKRKTPQRLSKPQCEKLVLEAVGSAKRCCIVGTPERKEPVDCEMPEQNMVVPKSSYVRPFPLLPRGKDSDEVLLQPFGPELIYNRCTTFAKRHPDVLPVMRSILLDWLIEVCEAYALQRQTFYLAQDYFDRFMMTQNNIQKDVLQLIGITCLFIAAKMEESRPPRLWQMVYVTADTYNEKHIIQMELVILKTLRWQLSLETPVSCMNLYFHLSTSGCSSELLDQRQFPLDQYLQMTRLLDLCILSFNALDFRYDVLAASVLCYFLPQETVETITDLPKHVLRPCVSWMAPFAQSASRFGRETLKDFAGKKIEDRHTIQTHSNYLTMLEDASCMPTPGQFPTPPNSAEKLGAP